MNLVDLYPDGVSPTLVSTRNRLVHGDLADTDEFFREVTRLGVLLRLLGWADLSNVPSKHDLDWIRRPAP